MCDPQVCPRRPYAACCCAVAEIDDDQPTRLAFPAPGDEILIPVISGPSGPITQFPVPVPEGWGRLRLAGGAIVNAMSAGSVGSIGYRPRNAGRRTVAPSSWPL